MGKLVTLTTMLLLVLSASIMAQISSAAFSDGFEDGSAWQSRWGQGLPSLQTLVSSPTHSGSWALEFRSTISGSCHSSRYRTNFEAASGLYSAWVNQRHHQAGFGVYIQVQTNSNPDPHFHESYYFFLQAANAQPPGQMVLMRQHASGQGDILAVMPTTFLKDEWVQIFVNRTSGNTVECGYIRNGQVFSMTGTDPNPITTPGRFYLWACSDVSPYTYFDDVNFDPAGSLPVLPQAIHAEGVFGQGHCFNGTDHYIEVPHSTSLNLSNNYSIEAWVYLDELPTSPEFAIVSKWQGTGSPGFMFGVAGPGSNRGKLVLNAGYGVDVYSTTVLQPQRWHHVAVTVYGQYMQFYVDGAPNPMIILSGGASDNSSVLAIGRNTHVAANPYFFKGKIDEVRVSNRARSLYEFALTAPSTPDGNTMAIWHLDDNTYDWSGHGNDGVIHGTGCAATEQISVSSNAIDIKGLDRGQAKSEILTVHNMGSKTITLALNFDNTKFACIPLEGSVDNFQIPGGGYVDIDVSNIPNQSLTAIQSDELKISSAATDQVLATVPLKAYPYWLDGEWSGLSQASQLAKFKVSMSEEEPQETPEAVVHKFKLKIAVQNWNEFWPYEKVVLNGSDLMPVAVDAIIGRLYICYNDASVDIDAKPDPNIGEHTVGRILTDWVGKEPPYSRGTAYQELLAMNDSRISAIIAGNDLASIGWGIGWAAVANRIAEVVPGGVPTFAGTQWWYIQQIASSAFLPKEDIIPRTIQYFPQFADVQANDVIPIDFAVKEGESGGGNEITSIELPIWISASAKTDVDFLLVAKPYMLRRLNGFDYDQQPQDQIEEYFHFPVDHPQTPNQELCANARRDDESERVAQIEVTTGTVDPGTSDSRDLRTLIGVYCNPCPPKGDTTFLRLTFSTDAPSNIMTGHSILHGFQGDLLLTLGNDKNGCICPYVIRNKYVESNPYPPQPLDPPTFESIFDSFEANFVFDLASWVALQGSGIPWPLKPIVSNRVKAALDCLLPVPHVDECYFPKTFDRTGSVFDDYNRKGENEYEKIEIPITSVVEDPILGIEIIVPIVVCEPVEIEVRGTVLPFFGHEYYDNNRVVKWQSDFELDGVIYLAPKTETCPWVEVQGFSPVDLRLFAPTGDSVTMFANSVPNAFSSKTDVNWDGDFEEVIHVSNAPQGSYLISPLPKPEADSNELFSILVLTQDDSISLAHNVPLKELPHQGYAFNTLPYASMNGHVKDPCGSGLLGVNLDIFDSDGNLWKSLVTDAAGLYSVDSVPNGHYTIAVVTPLGYQADQETKQFTLNHVPVTVNFTLTPTNVTPNPRTRAYWANQLQKALQNRPQDFTATRFAEFIGLINSHFNQNQVNPVDFYTVPQPASRQDSLNVLKQLLNLAQSGVDDPFLKRLGKGDLMALMLNVVAGKIHQMQSISRDGISVNQVITYCDMLLNDEIDPPNDGGPGCGQQFFGYLRADFILTLINLGLPVPNGIIPADVMEIAYKERADEPLPESFDLEQNRPNPFNPSTEISYSIPVAGQVELTIYNIVGQKVKTLVDAAQSAGTHKATWDGADEYGIPVSSGVYLYRLHGANFTATRKMILMK